MYTHTRTFFTIQTELWVGQNKTGTAVNAACQGNLSACHFGHACHRFIRKGIGRERKKKKRNISFTYFSTTVSRIHNFSAITADIPQLLSLQSEHKREIIDACQVRCNFPFSPHGTHNCVSAPTMRKNPEERRPSRLSVTNKSLLLILWGQSVLTEEGRLYIQLT